MENADFGTDQPALRVTPHLTVTETASAAPNGGSRAFACAHTVPRLCSGVSAGPPGRWTPAGRLEIGIAEGTARLEVNTGHGHVHNLLENATRPEEADETVEGARPHLLRRHHHPPLPTRFRHRRRRATMTINQSRPAIAVTRLRRLASAIERAAGEDTGSAGTSR
ncbi:MAG TPA: hypothetical protein VLW50_12545 [Streptosporangiaceae bacterium]|nr:hypothetical protein [Streptosporangiaceae bacterium]